jgi:EmrB/QacA subfamily drug resistance transporter
MPATSPVPSAPQFSHREILEILTGALLGLLLAALDQTVVVTALPAIAGDLNGLQHLAWIVTAYLLTSTASTPIYGKLSDLYGRRRLLQIGVAIFVVASLFCALSQTMAQLIAARALQGIGGGALISMAQAIIADVISPRERGRYQVYMSGVWALASLGGPVMGGLFVQYLSWRWVFWVNLPIGIFGLMLCNNALKKLPVHARQPRIDYLGAAILVPAVVALLLVASWGGTELPWTSPAIWGLLGVGVLLIAAFALQELRAREPLLPPRLFTNPVIRIANLTSFIVSAGMFGAIVLLPVFLQLVLGKSPGNTGLLLIPLMGGTVLGAYPAGQWMRHTGRYKLAPIVTLAGASLAFLLLATTGPATPPLLVAFYILLLGTGMGASMPVMLVATQNAADQRDTGAATGSVAFFRSLGGSFGAAALWSALLYFFNARLTELGEPNLAATVLQGGTVVAGAGLTPPVRAALAHSFDLAFIGGAIIMAISVVSAMLLKEIPLRTTLGPIDPIGEP